jgi:hypothetical protein
MHFLDSGIEFFTENLRAVKNEHAQWFYNISIMEKAVPRPVESQYADLLLLDT